MKYINLAAEFESPTKALGKALADSGARNINLHPTCDGWVSVRYEIKMPDPQKDIIQLVERTGAKLYHFGVTAGGANFDFRIDDRLDEREFKRQMINQLKSAGYRAN